MDAFDLGILTQPTAWFGLATLVVLEIVLSIDNLIFIAILSERLPPRDQNRARVIGLSLALVMRLILLASIAWVMSLTTPLFTLLGRGFSLRDVVLILGGLFLLVKSTLEIHDRLEGESMQRDENVASPKVWPIILQIVVLDAVFSLDSIITAIGMVDQIALMMAAVVIAMLMMLFASRPLTVFINAHPALIILCLGFLLMIGAVLFADGLGYHIPRGYLYSAIGFSVLIETFNQMAARNRRRRTAEVPYRQRAANAVLHLLGAVPAPAQQSVEAIAIDEDPPERAFAPVEQAIVQDVLAMADRAVQSIMTPRRDVAWLNVDDTKETMLARLQNTPVHQLLVARGSLDEVLGVVHKDDVLSLYVRDQGNFDLDRVMHAPLAVPGLLSVLDTLDVFRRQPLDLVQVMDEYGNLLGILTKLDLLEAMVGDFAGLDNPQPSLRFENGGYLLDGVMSLYDAQKHLHFVVPETSCYTIAGFVTTLFNRLPEVGERIEWQDWCFEVVERKGWRIDRLRAQRLNDVPTEGRIALWPRPAVTTDRQQASL